MSSDTEIWKPIPIADYVNLYEVSNMGYVRRIAKSKGTHFLRILNLGKHNKGYWTVNLTKYRRPKRYLVHRLVAITFIPNPNNLPTVNHKDGNRKNNHVSNLEWMSYSDNHNHVYQFLGRVGTAKGKFGRFNKGSKAVLQLSLDGHIIKKFFGISEAAKETNGDASDISKVCRGKRPSSNGFIWRFCDE